MADAAASVGMSRWSAYRLRDRDPAVAAAWRVAPLDVAMVEAAFDAAIERGDRAGTARVRACFDGRDRDLVDTLRNRSRRTAVLRDLG